MPESLQPGSAQSNESAFMATTRSIDARASDFYSYASGLDAHLSNFFTRHSYQFTLRAKDRTGPRDLVKDATLNLSYINWSHREDAQTPSKKPVIVVLPGIFSNARHVDYTSLFASKTHDVCVLDWPGQGKSDNLPNYHEYNFKNHAAIVHQFLESELKDREVVLYGSSFGAMIAYELANQDIDYFNKRISKFVTIDQGPINEDDSALRRPWRAIEHRAFHDTDEMIKGMKVFFGTHGDPPPESYCSHITNNSFHQDPRTGDLVWSLDPNVLNGFHEQLVNQPLSYWNTAAGISVPWLCVHGEMSDTLSEKSIARLSRQKNVDFLMIPNTGHVPGMYHPLQVEAVCSWLDKGKITPHKGISLTSEYNQTTRRGTLLPTAELDTMDADVTPEEKLCMQEPSTPFFDPANMRTARQIVEAKALGLS